MKTLLWIAASLFSVSESYAQPPPEYPNMIFKIDWGKPVTLEGSVAQQCDDTYYPAVEIVVPNKVADLSVQMSVTILKDGKIAQGCSVEAVKTTATSTTYILDGSDGGCKVEVFYLKARPNQKNYAVFEISDAC